MDVVVILLPIVHKYGLGGLLVAGMLAGARTPKYEAASKVTLGPTPVGGTRLDQWSRGGKLYEAALARARAAGTVAVGTRRRRRGGRGGPPRPRRPRRCSRRARPPRRP